MIPIIDQLESQVNWSSNIKNLNINETNVFLIEICKNSDIYSLLFSFLSTEEKEKAQKFLNINDSYRFVCAHAHIRYLLSKIIDIPVNKIEIITDSYHKPYIKDYPFIQFNISHSGSFVLLGISKEKIGVDIEFINANVDYIDISNNFFSESERFVINKSLGSLSLFYKYWTCKEAILKAEGFGLSIPLSSIEINKSVCTIDYNDLNWSEYRIISTLRDNYYFAIATKVAEIKYFKQTDLALFE